MHSLVVHPPSGVTKGVVTAAPPPARVLGCERSQERAQRLFFVVDRGEKPLGRSALTNHETGPSLRNPELFFE
jgi:hypothetical protein